MKTPIVRPLEMKESSSVQKPLKLMFLKLARKRSTTIDILIIKKDSKLVYLYITSQVFS